MSHSAQASDLFRASGGP